MPVPTRVQPEKNIWVAAGDGDLQRVQELVERQSISPNAPDQNTYTPMHAAASYGQLQILDYLISQGGDVNITDEDGDTPLYTVENLETATYLVEHGALIERQNNEGTSPAEHLQEDFPAIASYLHSHLANVQGASAPATINHPSQHAQDVASENLTSSLMESVHGIMQRAEAEGTDPDEELRRVVGQTVLEGMITGYGMGADGGDERRHGSNDAPPNGTKRSRIDDGTR
ncbi:hypothetical protein JAAARDRAFT_35792 [Jaapia argillacea MUCL 33604]|uniref:Uncharacterized protein n=1 Tax=Jaapia argillacea MUCL 33604 TaxID=933084 RepID=A0A067PQU4_9AGAM|nr:hypothetical protein JAAARDRAFT_35792 [Jaapia argillacea MUCL 33604]